MHGTDNRARPVVEEAAATCARAELTQIEGRLSARPSDRLPLQDYTATKGNIMGCAPVSADGHITYDEGVTMHRHAIQYAKEASSC